MNKIEVKDLTFSYGGGREILSAIGFCAKENESIGLIGANGVGKSTVLKLLVGLLLEYKGIIRVNGKDVNKKNLAAIRAKTGYVFQDSDSQLFMPTVYEDVAFAPRNHGYDQKEVDRRVMDALRKVHMEEQKDCRIYRMSGGQKKLASIATILSMEPEIILLDEPSIALDPRNRRNLIHILNEMQGLKIIASHDLDLILDTCGRTLFLSEGRIVKDAKTREILMDRGLLEKHGLELPLTLWNQSR